jgi:hypothetical protein
MLADQAWLTWLFSGFIRLVFKVAYIYLMSDSRVAACMTDSLFSFTAIMLCFLKKKKKTVEVFESMVISFPQYQRHLRHMRQETEQ